MSFPRESPIDTAHRADPAHDHRGRDGAPDRATNACPSRRPARGGLAAPALGLLALAGCAAPASQPAPSASGTMVLQILSRDHTGTLVTVPGIPVHRSDPVTGALLETLTTDAAGRVDFGMQSGPVTLSVVRPAAAGGGTTRAYTLLAVPPGSARLRLDRLPGEPATVLSTVDVALSPALTSVQGGAICLPTGWQGNAGPGDAVIPGLAITDHDVQDDGTVSILTQVEDGEAGTAVDCRLTSDIAMPANNSTVPAAAAVAAAFPSLAGAMTLDRLVTVRKGVDFPGKGGCAVAWHDAEGFSLQGYGAAPGAGVAYVGYFQESHDSERRGALWVPGPTLDPAVSRTIPSADVAVETLSYGARTIHFALSGSEVRSLVGVRASVRWSASGNARLGPFEREWYLYAGLAVGPATCAASDAACAFEVRLPDLAAMGTPPDQVDGSFVEVEALAPSGLRTGSGFWTELRARGDLEALLARGYVGARHVLRLWQPSYTVSVDPFVSPGWLPYGRVTGTGGIDCSLLSQASCLASLPAGSAVTLVATPNSGAELTQWIGGPGCGGATTQAVSFILTGDMNCEPHLQPAAGSPGMPLSVAVLSVGNGLITTDDGFISCGYDMAGVVHSYCGPFNYSSGSVVVLHASPSNILNAYDVTWSGDCVASPSLPTSASVLMDRARSCGVTFTQRP